MATDKPAPTKCVLSDITDFLNLFDKACADKMHGPCLRRLDVSHYPHEKDGPVTSFKYRYSVLPYVKFLPALFIYDDSVRVSGCTSAEITAFLETAPHLPVDTTYRVLAYSERQRNRILP